MAPPKQKPRGGKKAIAKPAKGNAPDPSQKQGARAAIPLELQQLLLNIFNDSFSDRLRADIRPLLQEVKGLLFNRDFSTAFGKDEYLEAYAARWSPSRALGYLHLFNQLRSHILSPAEASGQVENVAKKVVCLGGGAGAEIVALGGLASMSRQSENGEQAARTFEIAAIDIANWTSVVENLTRHITTAPVLSIYASADAQAANVRLVNRHDFNVNFHQHDILNSDFSTLSSILQDADVITIMFTLNELYSTSMSLTQKFLLNLTACLQPGALLLVVDSPGSYSTVRLNGAEKKYPMQWLLDHTLLREGAKGEAAAWVKTHEDESQWFRLLPELRYPIELENMRFQMHLYRRSD